MQILHDLNFILSVIIGLLILVVLVVVHELGHAIAARRNGVVVEEFGIGFPPRAYARKLKNGIRFTLNWLPLGGFVKLQGEHDAADKEGDYGAASFWVKTKILLAGVMINWLTAAALFMVLSWFGLPKILPNQFSVHADTHVKQGPVEVVVVVDNSPAQMAGLRAGDDIISFDGQTIDNADKFSDLTKTDHGQTVELTYRRDGQVRQTSAKLNQTDTDNRGYLGVGTNQQEFIRATWSSPIVGVGTTLQLTGFTFKALGQMLANLAIGVFDKVQVGNQAAQTAGSQKLDSVSNNVAGPVGILGVIFPAARAAGLTTLVMLTAIISLTLAVMNILPIPGLDGGRWFLTALFKAIRKPLTKEREEKIVATGMMVLFGLIILVTVADIGKLGG